MATSKRPTMLRLPEELYEKLRFLAYVDNRSVNREIEYTIECYIKEFERKNGPIRVSPSPTETE